MQDEASCKTHTRSVQCRRMQGAMQPWCRQVSSQNYPTLLVGVDHCSVHSSSSLRLWSSCQVGSSSPSATQTVVRFTSNGPSKDDHAAHLRARAHAPACVRNPNYWTTWPRSLTKCSTCPVHSPNGSQFLAIGIRVLRTAISLRPSHHRHLQPTACPVRLSTGAWCDKFLGLGRNSTVTVV